MRIVIKFAGALLEDDQTVRTLASQVAALAKDGHQILVVHGGGRLVRRR
jgi:acetylglutamate kinase